MALFGGQPGSSLVVCAAGPQKPLKRAKVEQKVVVIKGNQASVNTGLTIGPHDLVTITASGRVCFSGSESASCVGPNGWAGGRNRYVYISASILPLLGHEGECLAIYS